ncbi:hypothetical protein JI435_201570, partial [Parastagonospora nodorum SN15]
KVLVRTSAWWLESTPSAITRPKPMNRDRRIDTKPSWMSYICHANMAPPLCQGYDWFHHIAQAFWKMKGWIHVKGAHTKSKRQEGCTIADDMR